MKLVLGMEEFAFQTAIRVNQNETLDFQRRVLQNYEELPAFGDESFQRPLCCDSSDALPWFEREHVEAAD